MESIEKLREALKGCITEAGVVDKFDTYWITASACDEYIDKIEAEIAERYIELPVDADGVPIRIGEEIVRCKDCEFAAYECRECMRVDEWDDSLWFPIEPEGFCAWGERAVISDTTETELKWTL